MFVVVYLKIYMESVENLILKHKSEAEWFVQGTRRWCSKVECGETETIHPVAKTRRGDIQVFFKITFFGKTEQNSSSQAETGTLVKHGCSFSLVLERKVLAATQRNLGGSGGPSARGGVS